MLLAAGRGERMGELTLKTPKPLLPVHGKPLLWHHLNRLSHAGFKEVVINTSYLGEQIQNYVGDGARWNLQVKCTCEPERLETAGGILNALPLLGKQPFLVINGDVWTDYPIEQIPRSIPGLAHLILVDNPLHHPEGDFAFSGNEGVTTGKVLPEGKNKLTFSGLSVLSPDLFNTCKPGPQPLAPLLRSAMNKSLVTGEHYQGVWIDVGTPERLQQVAPLVKAGS